MMMVGTLECPSLSSLDTSMIARFLGFGKGPEGHAGRIFYIYFSWTKASYVRDKVTFLGTCLLL